MFAKTLRQNRNQHLIPCLRDQVIPGGVGVIAIVCQGGGGDEDIAVVKVYSESAVLHRL